MKALSRSALAASTTLLVGCSVQIKPSDAVALLASPTEVQHDPEASTGNPSGKGAWVLITALVAKNVVQRVSRLEVYPHVYAVECAGGKVTNVGTEPRLEGVDFANANDVKALLLDHSAKQTFVIQSLIFVRKADFQTPQCLQFRGGSYFGAKIAETNVPIRPNGQLP